MAEERGMQGSWLRRSLFVRGFLRFGAIASLISKAILGARLELQAKDSHWKVQSSELKIHKEMLG